MNDAFQRSVDEAAAFQKIWTESFSKILQASFTMGPNSPPPEVMRHIRSGIFQALSQSWEEFMRSPQFLEGMRQWMENAVNFRKLTNDFLARARNEIQAPSRTDVDTIILSVHHMEKRLLDRIEQLSNQVAALQSRSAGNGKAPRAQTSKKRPRASRSRTAGGTKTTP